MKKLLLSMAAVLGMGFMAQAETYTYTATEIFGNATENTTFATLTDNTAYAGGFAFVGLKNDGSTEPTYNGNNKDVRVYAKGTLEVKANGANITSISFEISKQGLKRLTDITPSTGAFAEQGVNPLVWNGNAASIVYTVGEKAVYGSEGEAKAGQFDFSSVTITTNGPVTDFEQGGGDTPVTPPTPANGAVYEKASAMSAGSYVIYAEEKVAVPLAADKAYGYIQVTPAVPANNQITTEKANAFEFIATEGGYNIKDSYGRYVYQTGTYNSFNVSEGFAEGVEASCYVWAVDVVGDSFVILNTNVEKTIQYDTQYGSFGSYPDVRGVYPVLFKYVKDAEGGEVPPVVNRTSITDLANVAVCQNNELIQMDIDLTVIYANGSYNYVCAGNAYGLIYKKDLGLEAGQVIAKGWTGKVSIYNNLFELVPDDATLATAGTANVPEPVEIEADEVATALVPANQNTYVKLLDVVFAEATPAADANKDENGNDLRNFTGDCDGTTVAFYQRFGVESVSAGTYTVTGFVSVYKEQVQVYPVKISNPSGISSAINNANEPAEYYNLQGVKVANPAAGNVYIRVQGTQASKVLY